MAFTIISAGAGSGKTFRLTQEMVKKLKEGFPASGIIATTFTQKAASELQNRVSISLLKSGMRQEAEGLSNALIGTVHSLGIKLLQRFAFEAGVSPQVSIITEGEPQYYFNLAMTSVLTLEKVEKMEELSRRLSIIKDDRNEKDWRTIIKDLADIARSNNFSASILRESAKKSIQSLLYLTEPPTCTADEFDQAFRLLLPKTLQAILQAGDTTSVTTECVEKIKKVKQMTDHDLLPPWEEYARLSKLAPGAKSREAVKELKEFAASHLQHPRFHEDIASFIGEIFELAIASIQEYNHYKNQRGLIDFTDMEVKVDELLLHPRVIEILKQEISILMVDEFQDTSPIQLSIFLKLSQIAKHTIWVGDPKQSIYGFRGAEPALMKAIIDKNGGVKPEDIQGNSYRSRQDLVTCVNALFVRGFDDMPPAQVALQPTRTKIGESPLFGPALNLWEVKKREDAQGKKSKNSKEWVFQALAHSLIAQLEQGIYIQEDSGGKMRPALPGDVAILCRTNQNCLDVAAALKKAGIQAAISQPGIFASIEGTLILACLKYVQSYDEISLTEILLLGEKLKLQELLELRVARQRKKNDTPGSEQMAWGEDFRLSKKLMEIRKNRRHLSVFELLDQVISALDLKRIIVEWGNPEQRLENIDQIRTIALTYEESCKSLHIATSLSGFIFWCQRKIDQSADLQGAGEHPDAVRVLTYHKSKGLEWPIVLLLDADRDLNVQLNNFTIVPENQEIDLHHILSNRWVRLWINPYGKNNKKTKLWEKIEQSPEWAMQYKQDLAEEIRIFYVGFTRARDYIILPRTDKKLSVVHRIYQKDEDEDGEAGADMDDTLAFRWGEEMVTFNKMCFDFEAEFPERVKNASDFWFTEPAKGQTEHKEKRLGHEELNVINELAPTFDIPERLNLWDEPDLKNRSEQEVELFKQAIVHFLNEWHPEEEPYKIAMISEDLIQAFSLEDLISSAFFTTLSEKLNQLFEPFYIEYLDKNCEIIGEIGKREYGFLIPLVLESPDEYIFIHFITDASGRELEKVLEDQKNRLALENELMKKNKFTEHIQNWILFIPEGNMIKINWKLNGSLSELVDKL
jgi:ATP-dependent exoDNAse (exonuclease V) beta subunit